MDDLRRLIASMKAEEDRVLAARTAASHARSRRMAAIIFAGSVLGMLVISLATFIINEDLTRRTAVERSLQREQASLEERVAARTTELASANAELRREIEARHRSETALEVSEKRYRTLFDQSPVGVCAFTSDLVVTQGNTRLAQMLDRDGESMVGVKLDDLFGEGTLPAPGLLRGEPVQVVVERSKAKPSPEDPAPAGGGPRWLSVHLAPLADDAGGVLGGLAVVEDVTERKLAEMRLSAGLERTERIRDDLLSVLEQLRLGAAVVDRTGAVAFVGRAAERLLGVRAETALARPWKEVLPLGAPDTERLEATLAAPHKLRSKLVVELGTDSPEARWVEIEVHDHPHDPLRRILVFQDVSEVQALRRLLHDPPHFQDLVGRSRPMQQVYEQIRELAPVDSTVLVQGDTGTGKELVARAIHTTSRRGGGPFVAVNCAGLTESLATTQFFGHRRGAFTGAHEDHRGYFEAAEGGTLFLDEIGDLPLSVQTALLRVLQEKEVARVGEAHTRKIDVRVIAATQHDLAAEVAAGRFRADLLYRIRVATIRLPPLRERLDDLPLLAATFMSQHARSAGKEVDEVSAAALRALMEFPWPGNVRELKAAIESAVIKAQGRAIQLADFPPDIVDPARRRQPPRAEVAASPEERSDRLLRVLQEARGNRAAAARRLGISRTTLYRYLARLRAPGGSAGPDGG
jgi:PAS domain S-box-containing protein